MRLTSVHLQNYRTHVDLEVAFHDRFNVVVGINGSGKTSLLRGVAEALAGLLWGVPGISTNRPLNENDCVHLEVTSTNSRYRHEPCYPVTLGAKAELQGKEAAWSFTKANEMAHAEMSGTPPSTYLRQIQDRQLTDKPENTFPLVAFYRAHRQWLSQENELMVAATSKVARVDGFKNWDNAATGIADLQHWVIAKCLERFQLSSETGRLFSDIDDDELAIVNRALHQIVGEIGGLRYDMQQKSLLVDWCPQGGKRESLSFDNLSDGQRAVVCLVADIARRMCLLNPHLGVKVTEKTPGVVVIDELDVHLHPHWQRLLVNGLKAAFPAVQFITASHSPQILGELSPEEIVLLRGSGTDHPRVSYGLDSSQVLEEIMGTSPRNQKVSKQLERLYVLVENDKLGDARILLDELQHDAPDIPELSGVEALILRKEVIGR